MVIIHKLKTGYWIGHDEIFFLFLQCHRNVSQKTFSFSFKETDLQYSYEGDRTREDIVAFAHRLMGPPVNLVASRTDFNRAKDKSEIFFLFSGEESGPVFVSVLY